MPPVLRLSTFGGFRLSLDGAPAPRLATRKDEALLLYLAHTGQPQPREHLAELLWENRAPGRALSNLRTALARVNKHLASYLRVTRESAAFDGDSPHWFDFAALQAALDLAERAAAGGPLSLAAANTLQQALVLYRGEFLAGFFVDSPAFETWLLARREGCRAAVLAAQQALARAYRERGMFGAALRQVEAWLALDEWDEAAHRERMRLLAYQGQTAAALAHYAAFEPHLGAELGVEPEAETAALAASLRSGRLAPPPAAHMPRHNLPAPPTPFVGRAAELAQVRERLRALGCRALTLLGPGGIGKTRLALEAARGLLDDFADGIFFVPLAPLTAPGQLLPAVADALGFIFYSAAERERQLLDHLAGKALLLVLDNFEHLLAGAGWVAAVLRAAPGVKCLTTSRERLGLQGECLLDVGGLALEPTPDGNDALRLFVQAAQRVSPGFELGADEAGALEICRLTDGMPLALELAAGWTRVLPCAAIAAQIRSNLDFLAARLRDVDARQRSLRAVFDHSWLGLAPAERECFMRLSVFAGTWDLAAAQAVAQAAPDTLLSLAEKSMLRSGPAGRFSLHPLLCQYAEDHLLARGEQAALQARHFDHYAQAGRAACQAFFGSGGSGEWYARLRQDYADYQSAMAWGLAHERGGEVLVMCLGAWYYWFEHGRWTEGYDWLSRALAAGGGATVERARGLNMAAQLASRLMDHAAAVPLHAEGEALAEALDDPGAQLLALISRTFMPLPYAAQAELFERGLALAEHAASAWGRAALLQLYGDAAREHGDLEKAGALYQRALAAAAPAGLLSLMAYATGNLGRLALLAGDYAQARERFEAALALAREAGSRVTLADWLIRLGLAALHTGDLAQARACLEQNLRLWREIGNPAGQADALCALAELACAAGDLATAHQQLRASLARWHELLGQATFQRQHLWRGVAECLRVAGLLAAREAQPALAVQALAASERLRAALGYPLEPKLAHARDACLAAAADALTPDRVRALQADIQGAPCFTWDGLEIPLNAISLSS